MKHQDQSTDLKYFDELLPSLTCVICGKSLPEIGGRRITAQKLRGMAVWDFEASLHDRGNLIASERLITDEEIYLVIWGEEKRFTDEVVERIRTTYLSGLRPWMCSAETCGCRQCPECGKANNMAVMSDILYDDGRNPHVPAIPAYVGCTNMDCKNYRRLDDGWEVVKYQKP